MSQMIEVKVAELVGAALDWAVFCSVYGGCQPTIEITEAHSINRQPFIKPIQFPRAVCLSYSGAYGMVYHWQPSSDWEQCGPLIEKHSILICPPEDEDFWEASVNGDCEMHLGASPLIAACRAIVFAKYGAVVSVPAELTPH